MAELPAALRRDLPAEAQRVYRLAYREARGEGVGDDEARLAAQQAVEERFRRVGDRWEPREARPTTGPPYGEEALAALARRARFPCTSGQLVQQVGDPVLEIAAGQPMALREVLDVVEGAYWREPNELLEAVHAAWPRVKKRWDEAYAGGPGKPLSQAGR